MHSNFLVFTVLVSSKETCFYESFYKKLLQLLLRVLPKAFLPYREDL